MRVLVTGASGYVGQAVVRQLSQTGHDVVALVHRSVVNVPEGVELRRGDVLDGEGLLAAADGVHAAVHLVSLTRIREAFAHPTLYYRVNLGGTLHVLEALARQAEVTGVKPRLVMASTASVYGSPPDQPITESTPLAPANPYAASKVAAEEAIRWQVATGSLGAVCLRIFNIAGAVGELGDYDDTRVITRAVGVAAGHLPSVEIHGDGSAVRDFVHVSDVARAMVAALESAEPGRFETYNVGATPASVAEVVDTVRRVTGREIRVTHRPANPGEAPRLVGDSSLLRQRLGWSPLQSSLEEMVRGQWEAELLRRHR
ncbi:UDP-glucose 4-epimerase [Crossiella equi]|uniref:UDP-glucose 4-epimerase n=1 Tax=Crossiella equi TaxID=130796 RepID=A0ABS5ABJ0_9PSEU|nr:NAD-dependent epimerase/dehydratase family protein [Crossiella equi]MBP2473959.1 UDP-glucose 4-epimerase [Crossiella equi]